MFYKKIREMKKNSGNIFVFGGSGTGKTQLIKEYIKDEKDFIIIDFHDQYNKKDGKVIDCVSCDNVAELIVGEQQVILNCKDIKEKDFLSVFKAIIDVMAKRKDESLLIIDDAAFIDVEFVKHLVTNQIKFIVLSQDNIYDFMRSDDYSEVVAKDDILVVSWRSNTRVLKVFK